MGIIIGIVVFVVVVLLATSYNRFVNQRQLIDNTWSNVDTELKRRHDLVPNLVATVQGYADHERATLEEVVRARAGAEASADTPLGSAPSENVLTSALGKLLAVSEAYPDLEADTGFLDLQAELVRTENRIQAARRFYNNNVRDYNTRVQSVPSNVLAKVFGFHTRDFFEIDEAHRDLPHVSFDDGAP